MNITISQICIGLLVLGNMISGIIIFLDVRKLSIFFVVILASAPRIYAHNIGKNVPKANSYVSENIIDFVGNNFERFLDHVSIVSFDKDDRSVHSAIYHLLLLSWKKRSKLHKTSFYTSVQYLGEQQNMVRTVNMLNRNIIAIASSTDPSRWQKYLNLSTKTKTNSVILVLTGVLDSSQVRTLYKMINELSSNSMFYVMYRTNKDPLNCMWYQIINLHGYDKSIINLIEFDSSGKIIENYDLQGIHLLSVSLTWSPYFIITNCANQHKNCQSEGYLAETMDILSGMLNFTWESHREKDSFWGTKPISGPANSSGVWGGVIGQVFNGTYQLSIRYQIFTFVIFLN